LGGLAPVRWIFGWRTRRQIAEWLESVGVHFGGFENKLVLDVGSDVPGDLLTVVAEKFGPREIVGLNLATADRTISSNARMMKGDIRRTGFPDNHFDLIFSSSAFEHITGLDEAMTEMHRILKPGGFLFSHFGPIWSTSYGHHLWTIFEGRLYTYWDVVLPPYAHLLMSAAEIEALLIENGYEPHVARYLGEYVKTSTDQNQLFFEDYEAIFARGAFEILMFKGYDAPALAATYRKHADAALLERLRRAFPDRRNFFYDGITTLMRK
jgi:ubiquinone/menaquinone biosynthesis C-methylase UbiE